MLVYNREGLLKLYDTDRQFKRFMQAYVEDYLSGVRGPVKDVRDMIAWDKKDMAQDYSVAVAKLDGKYVGISFRIRIGKKRSSIFQSVSLDAFYYIYGTWVATAHRGKGVNQAMIGLLTSRVRLPVLCMIKSLNKASQRSYAAAGFRPVKEDWQAFEGTQWFQKKAMKDINETQV